MTENEIGSIIVDSAISVHKELGPGLLEKCYEACLEYELKDRGLKVDRQKELAITYKGITIDTGYKIDLLVEDKVVIELKAVRANDDIYRAQTLTYMKMGKFKLGYLINFNSVRLIEGLERFANKL